MSFTVRWHTGRERGATLVEVLVAAALLVTLVAGLAHLFVTSQQHAQMAERQAAATLVAQDRVQRLGAEAWSWHLNGLPADAPGLAPSPPGALDSSIAGYSDVVDRYGGQSEGDDAEGPAFVRRWSIAPARAADPDAVAIEVCVFRWPAVEDAAPLACLHTIRSRQP